MNPRASVNHTGPSMPNQPSIVLITPVLWNRNEERHGDRHRAGDRREVEGGAEEPTALERPVVDDQRQDERQRRRTGHEDEHVVQGVAHGDGEVLAQQRVLGEQAPVVVEPDEVERR